jgi:uncharacterized integral membrane protein
VQGQLDEHTPRRSRAPARFRVTPIVVLALVLLVIVVVLAAANSQKVTVDFVFEDYEVPSSPARDLSAWSWAGS